MKQPLVFSGVQIHLCTTWSVFHGFGMGCHRRCFPGASAEGSRSTGRAQVGKLDMGSCLMKMIVWRALETKTHSLCQLVRLGPAVPELLSVTPASVLLNVKDILGPVLFPLYPKCLLNNLSSAAAVFLPAAHFRHRTWYWLELINISMVLLPNVELSAVVATWQLVIYILEG